MKLESLRDRVFLARGSFSILFINAGGKLFALAMTGLLAAVLGAGGFGIYSVAISWVTVIAMFAALGFPMLLLREMATARNVSDWSRMRGVLHFSGKWVLVASLACALVGALLAWIAFPGDGDTALRSAIQLAMLLVPLRAFAKLRNGSLQGLRAVVQAQLPEQCIRPAAMLALTVLWALWAGWRLSAHQALILQLVAGTISVGLGTWWLWKALPVQVRSAHRMVDAVSWRRSATHMLLFSSMTILLAQSGILAMAFLATEAQVGVFALGVRLSEGLLIFLAAVNAPLMPIVARLYAEGEMDQLQRYLRLGMLLSLGAALPVAAGMFAGSDYILSLFGPEFTQGKQTFRILICAQVLNTAFGPVGMLLNMSGHEKAAALGISSAAAINVMLCLALVPIWGAMGAAWAMLLSTLTWNTWLTVLAWRRMGVVPGILSFAVRAS